MEPWRLSASTQLGRQVITAGGDSFEVFTLHPKPDGVLAAAGVRDGDIVLSHSITGFYRAIHEHRGSTITFRVADGDGGPIAERSVRSITVHLPAQHQSQ